MLPPMSRIRTALGVWTLVSLVAIPAQADRFTVTRFDDPPAERLPAR